MKILITDCLYRKTFDIYNIVKQNYNASQIILASDNNTWKGKLIYKINISILRKNAFEIFRIDLLNISKLFGDEQIIYLPIEEDTTLLFLNSIKETGSLNFRYLLPEFNSFAIARDKYLLNKFCIEQNIPTPILFEKDGIESLQSNFIPLIIKPRIGSGAKGIIHIDTKDELGKLRDIKKEDFVIQEKLKNGKDVKGAFFLCDRGNVISSYCHERIRTFPVDGGATSYSRISINEEIIKIGSLLLKKLNWSGFAMIEFLWDEVNNTYKVIEINPRLWGSILLSEFANTNFILNYINLCIGEPIIDSKINQDAKTRWMPFEFLNLIASKGKIKNFWKFNKKEDICYINYTYASWWSIIWFHMFFYFNFSNFKNLFLKWKK